MLEMTYPMIRRLVRALGGPDARILPGDKEELEKLLERLPVDIPLERDFVKKSRSMLYGMQDGVIYEVSLFQTVEYTAVYSKKKNSYLILGPSMHMMLKKDEFHSRMMRLDVPEKIADEIMEDIRTLPVVPLDRLQTVSTILGKTFLETDEEIPYRESGFFLDLGKQEGFFPKEESYEEIEKIRRVENRYEWATAFTEAVLKGNLALAYEFTGNMSLESKDLVRAHNPIRNAKNLLLAMNTQLRTAMQGIGIPPYRLDLISSRIAREIENAMGMDELREISKAIPRDYCTLSHESRYGRYQRLSREAATLIKNNLSGSIEVEDLARTLSVNADYLSYRFHKETGETIKDFVNRERCEMAASLLENTSMQIQDIASHVGYNSTSYFSKMFLRHYGRSPKDYRRNGRIDV